MNINDAEDPTTSFPQQQANSDKETVVGSLRESAVESDVIQAQLPLNTNSNTATTNFNMSENSRSSPAHTRPPKPSYQPRIHNNEVFFRSFLERPLQVAHNLEFLVMFCVVVFSLVIWFVRKEQRAAAGGGGGGGDVGLMTLDGGAVSAGRVRTESNMSSSLEDNSNRSVTQPTGLGRRERSRSHEFLLSPALSTTVRQSERARSELRGEIYGSLNWAEEDEERPFECRRRESMKNRLQEIPPPFLLPEPSAGNVQSPQAAGAKQPKNAAHPHHDVVVHHGPYVTSMVYNTWTPPPSWAEAARRVFPRDVKTLRKTLKLNVLDKPATLTVSDNLVDPKQQQQSANKREKPSRNSENKERSSHDFCMAVTEFSVQVPPVEGVLEVYVKNSPKSEWMEHTFQSAQAAAQFQTDLLASQILGPAISNMYHVFRLIHQGSIAHDGQEFVLHDEKIVDESKEHLSAVGVAWDDVMRCFGSTFPRIRMQLEDLWWIETKPKQSPNKGVPDNSATGASSPAAQNNPQSADREGGETSPDTDGAAECSAEYGCKRLLLGPVDFFRLFIPTLPPDALPYTTSDVKRMEQMLRWRKRVARASLLLRSYARARQIVNIGWNLGVSTLPEGYWKFRLAYDMNIDNHARDKVSKNEYYEPYVSRDVFCRVRGIHFSQREWWYFLRRRRGESVMSLGQTFSLVRAHCFKMPKTRNSSLNPRMDPVLSIPSLCGLVEANHDVDFFVYNIYNRNSGISTVNVFVRNTPVGVDLAFDRVWDRFKACNEETRRKKLEVMFQLDLMNFTFPILQAFFLKFFAFAIWLLDIKGFVPQGGQSGGDRSTLPAMKLENYGKCYHFGGALQTNPKAPENYVSLNCVVDSYQATSVAGRLLMTFLTTNLLSGEIGDVIAKIRGDEEDELPERILSVHRMVQVALRKIPLPTHAAGIPSNQLVGSQLQCEPQSDEEIPTALHQLLKALFVDPFFALWRSFAEHVGLRENEYSSIPMESTVSSATTTTVRPIFPSIIASNDPFEKAVNKLVELLEDVRIPVRDKTVIGAVPLRVSNNGQWAGHPYGASPSADMSTKALQDIQQVPILSMLTRQDLRRYFTASECSLKKATVRIVESTAWRGLTFPIDTRQCRVELQTGQFFQQGQDLEGHPIFYFRNMCRGPWRGDEDAVIAAVVHRFEKSLKELAKEDPDVKCTVIVLLGRVKRTKKKKRKSRKGNVDSDSEAVSTADQEESVDPASNQDSTVDHSGDEAVDSFDDDDIETSEEDGEVDDLENVDDLAIKNSNNPRVPVSERLFAHSNERVAHRLIRLLMLHYPERLYRCLVVKGHRGGHIPRSVLGGMFELSYLVDSPNTRRKVKLFRGRRELQKYVDKSELIRIAGGDATVSRSAFSIE